MNLEFLTPYLPTIIRILLILAGTGVGYLVVKFFTKRLKARAAISEGGYDDMVANIVARLVNILVFICGGLLVIDSLGFNVSAAVMGLGLFGLGASLAAKDFIANFFGTIVIVVDKIFGIGDRIIINKKEEGIVVRMGLRSSTLKTGDGTPLTIPNSDFTNARIRNLSRKV